MFDDNIVLLCWPGLKWRNITQQYFPEELLETKYLIVSDTCVDRPNLQLQIDANASFCWLDVKTYLSSDMVHMSSYSRCQCHVDV